MTNNYIPPTITGGTGNTIGNTIGNTQPTVPGLWDNNGTLTWFDSVNNYPVDTTPNNDPWTQITW